MSRVRKSPAAAATRRPRNPHRAAPLGPARFPAGLGSYVLWATSGDAYALHCSDASVTEAVTFAGRAPGISATHPGTVVTARPQTADDTADASP